MYSETDMAIEQRIEGPLKLRLKNPSYDLSVRDVLNLPPGLYHAKLGFKGNLLPGIDITAPGTSFEICVYQNDDDHRLVCGLSGEPIVPGQPYAKVGEDGRGGVVSMHALSAMINAEDIQPDDMPEANISLKQKGLKVKERMQQSQKRVGFAPEAIADLIAHAERNTSVEVTGFLVGTIIRDGKADDDMEMVTAIVPLSDELVDESFGLVKITADAWLMLDNYLDELQAKNQGVIFLGSYHTHPNIRAALHGGDKTTFEQITRRVAHDSPGVDAIFPIVDPIKKEVAVYRGSLGSDGEFILESHYPFAVESWLPAEYRFETEGS